MSALLGFDWVKLAGLAALVRGPMSSAGRARPAGLWTALAAMLFVTSCASTSVVPAADAAIPCRAVSEPPVSAGDAESVSDALARWLVRFVRVRRAICVDGTAT